MINIVVLPKFVVKNYNLYYPKESSINHLFISINSYDCSKAVFPNNDSLKKNRNGRTPCYLPSEVKRNLCSIVV